MAFTATSKNEILKKMGPVILKHNLNPMTISYASKFYSYVAFKHNANINNNASGSNARATITIINAVQGLRKNFILG